MKERLKLSSIGLILGLIIFFNSKTIGLYVFKTLSLIAIIFLLLLAYRQAGENNVAAFFAIIVILSIAGSMSIFWASGSSECRGPVYEVNKNLFNGEIRAFSLCGFDPGAEWYWVETNMTVEECKASDQCVMNEGNNSEILSLTP